MAKFITWDNLLDASLSMPGATVIRSEFLKDVFHEYDGYERVATERPVDVFGVGIVNEEADKMIKSHLTKATAVSAAAGIPGGLAAIGTIAADLAQYYWHVIVLAQKLGYLYGWPSLVNSEGRLTESSRSILTIYIGVMLGGKTSEKAMAEVVQRIAVSAARKIPQTALLKTSLMPIIKSVAGWIGIQVSKQTVSKGISTIIPIIGGAISGGITYFTFRPMGRKLKAALQREMQNVSCLEGHYLFDKESETDEMPTEVIESVKLIDTILIRACINMALVDLEFVDTEVALIEEMISNSHLDLETKDGLRAQLKEKRIVDIDFSKLKFNFDTRLAILECLTATIVADRIVKEDEKVYLYKIAHDLGFSKDDVVKMVNDANASLDDTDSEQ